jgi:hypothetical protein
MSPVGEFCTAAAIVTALIFTPAISHSAWIWCKAHPSPLSWRDIPLALAALHWLGSSLVWDVYVSVRGFVRQCGRIAHVTLTWRP